MSEVRHYSLAELNARLPEVHSSPANPGRLLHIIARPVSEQRELRERSEVTPEAGLSGDRWASSCKRMLPDGRLNPDNQITIMNTRCLAILTDDHERWPLAGDNFLVDFDLSETNLPAGQRVKIGTAVLEVTPLPHTGCSKFSKRFGADALKFVNSPEGTKLRLRGLHVQVVQAGVVAVGDDIEKI
jgi:MOSC domain-containing protein YiiM